MLPELFLWLGGGDNLVLDRVPTERKRASINGGAVLTTAAIAVVSSMLTTRLFLHASMALAVLVGLGWGAAIMTLDRWMLISIRRHPRPWLTLALAAPRIALAVAGGFVFAKPIEVLAFNNEVMFQAHWDKKQEQLADLTALSAHYKPQINALGKQQTALTQRLSTGDVATFLAQDPVYSSDLSDTTKLQGEAQQAETAALCELDGTCGSHHTGSGPVYATKLARANELKQAAAAAERAARSRANKLIAQQRGAQNAAQAAEERDLSRVGSELATLQNRQAADEQEVRDKFNQPIGLADRLEALSKVMDSSATVYLYGTAIMLLILLVDAGPVLGKVLLMLGPETATEQEQRRQEQLAANISEAVCKADLEAGRIASSEVVAQAEIHRDSWDPVVKNELMPIIIDTQRRITLQDIRDWSSRELRASAARRHSAERTAANDPSEPRGKSGGRRGAGSATRGTLRHLAHWW